MALYAGLDGGTTTLSVVILHVKTGQLLARNTVANTVDTTARKSREWGQAELDLERLRTPIVQVLAQYPLLATRCIMAAVHWAAGAARTPRRLLTPLMECGCESHSANGDLGQDHGDAGCQVQLR